MERFRARDNFAPKCCKMDACGPKVSKWSVSTREGIALLDEAAQGADRRISLVETASQNCVACERVTVRHSLAPPGVCKLSGVCKRLPRFPRLV